MQDPSMDPIRARGRLDRTRSRVPVVGGLEGVTPKGAAPVRVRDLPIRLWHWAFAACVVSSLYMGFAGDVALMDWHQRSGFVAIAAASGFVYVALHFLQGAARSGRAGGYSAR